MSYERVIPRDLFNESSLLKCLGHLYIVLETTRDHGAEFSETGTFDIRQNENDGSIFAAGIGFSINGSQCHLYRPLNSRQAWPLWIEHVESDDLDAVQVFDDNGSLSEEMLALIQIT